MQLVYLIILIKLLKLIFKVWKTQTLFFAISNNFDPGTIFEIGYARALKKNVFMYLNYAAKKT